MYRLRTIGIAGVLAMTVAACSSGTGNSPSPSSTPIASASESTAPSVEATESAAASESEAALPSFELPNSAPELLALLPDHVGAFQPIPQASSSQTGAEFMDQAGDNQEFVDFLKRVGAQPEDVSVATKVYGDLQNPAAGVVIVAFRVEGADSNQLRDEMKSSFATDNEAITWSSSTIAGKDVQVGSDPSDSSTKTYLYVRDDIVFALIAPDDETAGEALSELP